MVCFLSCFQKKIDMKIIRPIITGVVALIVFFAVSVHSVSAQSSEAEIAKEPFRSDAIISMLLYYMPAGWTFSDVNGHFIIQRNDSIWILEENTMSTINEKKEDRNRRIQAKGEKTTAQIVIKYEKKWDFIKVQEASYKNLSITNEINALSNKYKIAHLKDTKQSTKEKIVYTPVSHEDVKLIENYYAEKKRLESQLIPTPDYSTQQYSLFIVSKRGCIDETHAVYPDKASLECYSILALLREVCGK